MLINLKTAAIKAGLICVILCVGVSRASSQVFVFRDYNQELLGLVANVANGYDERSSNFPIRFYEEYCLLYDEMRDWLRGTEAVIVMKELLDKGYDLHDVPVIALVFKPGFTEPREGYVLPDFMSDPDDEGYSIVQRLIERLRELYVSEKFNGYMEERYPGDYQRVVDGSDRLFDETGQVLEMIEESLLIGPPENFINFFSLFSTPNQNRSGIVDRSDGSRVIYLVTGINYDDGSPVFNMSPELVFNAYAYAVVDNARMRNSGWGDGLERFNTPKVKEVAMADDFFVDIETYMVSNAGMALSAFMFDNIGNRYYKDMILRSYSDYYLYLEPIFDKLKTEFSGQEISFYDYFPMLFQSLQPAD